MAAGAGGGARGGGGGGGGGGKGGRGGPRLAPPRRRRDRCRPVPPPPAPRMPHMAAPLDVCIRGAGMVGRTLALLLARDRLRVGLVDIAPAAPAQRDVRAYALNAASRELLLRLRAWPDEQHATPVAAIDVRGDEGGRVHFAASEEGVEALAWIVDVEPLLARLHEAVRFQPQVELLPEPRPAALTVVCEGRASVTRAE